MMRRAPMWLSTPENKARFHRWWPWVLSSVCAVMYFNNREPFDELAGSVVTKIRRPLLKTMEWIELHDVDPETMSLELPPDMLFGPLEFEKQMKFLLAALKADNEYADNYLARIIIDHMDLSLDPPAMKEEEFLSAGGRELLDFAIDDFTGSGKRRERKHIFFQPDQFLRLINLAAPYPNLMDYFVNERNGVELVLKALRYSTDAHARVLAMRSLTLFCFTQKMDGNVERQILCANGVKRIVDCYKQSSGDPADTRFLTLILSSILRHYPKEGGKEFLDADGIQAAVDNINISRYKGIPQHLRVIHDVQKLPKDVIGGTSLYARLEDAGFIGVAMGVLEAFPEYYEASQDILDLVIGVVPSAASPFELLSYRALPILSKFYVRWQKDEMFQTDGTRGKVARLMRLLLDDKNCQACFDPSVASYELQESLKTAKIAIENDEKKIILKA